MFLRVFVGIKLLTATATITRPYSKLLSKPCVTMVCISWHRKRDVVQLSVACRARRLTH